MTKLQGSPELEFLKSFPRAEKFIRLVVGRYPKISGKFIFGYRTGLIKKEILIVDDSVERTVYLNVVSGECYKRGPIFCRVNPDANVHFPFHMTAATGTQQLRGGKFKWMYESEKVDDLEELLVWIFGHELWHRLCFQRIIKGNNETKANSMAFSLLRQFRSI